MPKISVIVPVFKAENYIENCIESILKQSFLDFELILVDDGSPDNSPAICDNYLQKDGRVRVIHQQNGGVSVARNTGINNAQGEYLVFIDSDDYVASSYLEELYKGGTAGADVAICGYYAVVSKKRILKCVARSLPSRYIGTVKEVFSHIIDSDLLYSPWNKLFKTKILRDNHILFNKNINLGEDLCFNIAYFYYCEIYYICNMPLYFYVKSNSTLSKNISIDYFNIQKKLYETIKDFIEKKEIKYDLHNRLGITLSDILSTLANSPGNKKSVFQKVEEILHDNLIVEYIAKRTQEKRIKNIVYYLLRIRSAFIIFSYYSLKNKVGRTLQKIDNMLSI